ncbi:MAG: hypothetical protein JWL91_335 [Sphingomonas bacterium]|nr:hypothetical protein [Sphingomonas bacterium]MDB5688459.1 hypothetical protein [Sphingomonas bacterium]
MTQPVFFTDTRGFSYPVSRIAMIQANRFSRRPKPRPDNWSGFLVRLIDGDPVRVAEHELETIFTSTPVHMIPAAAETYMLSCDLDDPPETEALIWRTPVIAWAWTCDGIEPVTPDGLNDGHREAFLPILMPNGIVTSPGDRVRRDVGEWFRDIHRTAVAKRTEARS